jgi:hypothetical protein
MEFIDWRVFIVSLAIGLLFVYIVKPNMKTIYVFPNPENIDKIQYVDHANTCFDFTKQEVSCNDNNIENYIVQ